MPYSTRGATPSRLQANLRRFSTHHGWVLGVVNVTPDSFYPASRGMGRHRALAVAARLVEEGADGLDVGAESTRPGAREITEEEEMRRLLPVIETMRLRFPQLPLSVDTRKAAVALAALRRGVQIVNDISALRHDPAMADVLAQTKSPVVLMHMQGDPRTMQRRPRYRDVVDDVKSFFEERLRFAVRRGIAERRIFLDPGIGFGKTFRHNLLLLRRLREFLSLGRPLLVGLSRKAFIGRVLGAPQPPLPVEERLAGTLGASLWALSQGAAGFRTHDVRAARHAFTLWQAIERAA
jgi:dihydropteroate synthase